MSTNSSIAIKVGNEVKSIYCHWDGYLEWNGRILYNLYNEQYKVEALIEMGDISSLKGTIAESRFYKRDCNETNVEAKTNTLEDYLEKIAVQEFNYIFDVASRKWYVATNDFDRLRDKFITGAFIPLEYELFEVKENNGWENE